MSALDLSDPVSSSTVQHLLSSASETLSRISRVSTGKSEPIARIQVRGSLQIRKVWPTSNVSWHALPNEHIVKINQQYVELGPKTVWRLHISGNGSNGSRIKEVITVKHPSVSKTTL